MKIFWMPLFAKVSIYRMAAKMVLAALAKVKF